MQPTDPQRFPRKVRLTAAREAYLLKWTEPERNGEKSLSNALDALLERAERFWPNGPFTNPRMNRDQLAHYGGATPSQPMERTKRRRTKATADTTAEQE